MKRIIVCLVIYGVTVIKVVITVNNTLAVPKPSFIIGLTIIKVLIVNLRPKASSQSSFTAKTFPQTLLHNKDGIQDWVITLIEQVDNE